MVSFWKALREDIFQSGKPRRRDLSYDGKI